MYNDWLVDSKFWTCFVFDLFHLLFCWLTDNRFILVVSYVIKNSFVWQYLTNKEECRAEAVLDSIGTSRSFLRRVVCTKSVSCIVLFALLGTSFEFEQWKVWPRVFSLPRVCLQSYQPGWNDVLSFTRTRLRSCCDSKESSGMFYIGQHIKFFTLINRG